MSDYDVLIVGGGIAGASLGAAIAGSRRTLMIEAEEHCGFHSTGRSAAFWLESYGGAEVARLTAASRAPLEAGGFLTERGAVHLSEDEWPELPDGVDARRLSRPELEQLVPGIRPRWARALLEAGCADIDVAALHQSFLKAFRAAGGTLVLNSRLAKAERNSGRWAIELENGDRLVADVIVNAAGAWADLVALACGVAPLGISPRRRTMVQLRVGRPGLRHLPLVGDAEGTFYFKGEGESSLWLSPHDEIASDPCDAAPEEIDIATAIDRFEQVVDWPVERVERSWAGLRSFAPDRLPVYGFDPDEPAVFWCAGQGGFGIQTAPAASAMAAAELLQQPDAFPDIDPAIFSPRRFTNAAASGPSEVQEITGNPGS
jgi:D-arginine dehydrogenase